MDIVETTAGALYVALLGGLGFLAVQYPKTFRSVGLKISHTALAGFVVLLTFVLGTTLGGNAVMGLVPDDRLRLAQAALAEVRPNYLLIGAALVGILLFIFVMGLISFPLEAEQKERREKHDRSE